MDLNRYVNSYLRAVVPAKLEIVTDISGDRQYFHQPDFKGQVFAG